jgi:hypothetical protein
MGFRDELEQQVSQAACSIMNAANGASRWAAGARVVPRFSPFEPNFDPFRAAASAAGLFCNTPPVQPPAGVVGGQCPDNYCIYVRIQGDTANGPYDNGPNVNQSGQCGYPGPLGPPYIDFDSFNDRGVYVKPANFPPVKVQSIGGLSNVILTPDHYRQNGQPDSCSGSAPPPVPIPIGDRTVNIVVGGNNAQFALGNGIIQVNGDVTAPIRVNSPSFEFSGTLVLNTGGITFNSGGGDPTIPGGTLSPYANDAPPDPTDPPEEPDEIDIVGVLVTTTARASNLKTTTIWQAPNPDIYSPNLGFVNFRIKLGEGVYGWSDDYPVKNLRHYIPAPIPFESVAVKGTPRNGVTWTLTPVKGVYERIVLI